MPVTGFQASPCRYPSVPTRRTANWKPLPWFRLWSTKVNEDLSVGVGLDYCKANSVQLNSQLSSMSGDGDGWGWNASILVSLGRAKLRSRLSFSLRLGTGTEGALQPPEFRTCLPGNGGTGSSLPPAQAAEVWISICPGTCNSELAIRSPIRLAVELDWTRTDLGEFN